MGLFFVVFQSVVLILVAFLFQILCSLCVLDEFLNGLES